MKNLKMSKKFFLSFGAVILVILVLGGTAFFALNKMHQVINVYSEKTVPNTEYIWQMRRNIVSVQRYVLRTIASPDVEDTKKISQLADDESAALLQSLDDYRSNMRTDPALTDAIEKYIKEGADARKKVQDKALLCTPEANEQAYELYVSEYLPKVELMNDAVLKVADEIKKLEIEQNNSAKQVYNISFIGILVAFFGAVVLSIGMGATLSRNIVRPLKEIETAAKEMAKGSLTVDLTYKAKDELGILSDSMRILTGGVKDIIGDVSYLLGEMGSGNFRVATQIEEKYIGEYNAILLAMRKINGNLSSTLTQINQASDQVSSGSEQVSSGAQALSQGTTEQASSVEELAATINEISSQVKTNAQSAQQGSMLAESAGEKIEEGNRQMQELILAMSEISEKSGRIGKIIKTIEDIAFQTNILALNAAVEAARAGAAGKGFAVVADEVRNLASKSAEASKSTAALIEGSIHAVERGTQLADETAQTLNEVVISAKQVVTVVDGISQASNDQAASIAQVTQGIDQISSVVQTNSATAEESAAASEELSGQAQMLKDLVRQFQLRETNTVGVQADLPSKSAADTSRGPVLVSDKY